jgi:hypothetical protein
MRLNPPALSPAKARLPQGEMRLVGAVYEIETGEVSFLH